MAIVITDDTHYKQIADAIRKGTGDTEKMIPSDMPWMVNMAIDTKYHEGYEQGKQAEYDRHWDAYQDNGNRKNYRYAFAGGGWNEETFKPKYDMRPTSASYMFAALNAKSYNDPVMVNLAEILAELEVELDFSECTEMTYCFYQAMINEIGTIDLSACTTTAAVGTIFNSTYLLTIRNLIPPPVAMAATCWQTGLRNLTIGGIITKDMNLSRCEKLTDASAQSIIDNLKVLTPETTQTLTVHQNVRNRMTPEQVNTIVNVKNWTLAPAESTN